MDIRSLRDRAVCDVRPDPWEPPKLTGVTRVHQALYGLDDAIRADYESGMGCTLLARRYCLAENTMLAWLKSHGVELRPPGKLTPEDVVQMTRLREDGWTYNAIGEKFEVARLAVSRRLQRRAPGEPIS